MIARLRGALIAHDPMPIVEVGGVGFAVQVSARTAAQLPATGHEVTLVTYLHVREDHLSLYGFASVQERDMFLHLLSVSGIGPRVALTLLSSAPLEELEVAIAEGDDKIAKYPAIFRGSDALVVTKVDLLPHFDFKVDRVTADMKHLAPEAKVFQVSATTGLGIDVLGDWLLERRAR